MGSSDDISAEGFSEGEVSEDAIVVLDSVDVSGVEGVSDCVSGFTKGSGYGVGSTTGDELAGEALGSGAVSISGEEGGVSSGFDSEGVRLDPDEVPV